MAITASTLIATENPAGKDDLWRPPVLFLPDWKNPIRINTNWNAEVESLETAGEVRSGLVPKPARSIELTFRAMEQKEMALLRSWLQRMTMARTPVALFPDQLAVGTLGMGASFLSCAPTGRRYFAGGRVAMWPVTSRTMAEGFDLLTIGSVGADYISLNEGTTREYLQGAMIAPVMESELVAELSGVYETDAMMSATLTFREGVSEATLDPLATPGEIPPGVSDLDGLPIFAIPAHWGGRDLAGGARRLLETSKLGLTTQTQTHGERFAVTQSMTTLRLDRSSAAAVLRFFDCRGGRQKPFLAADLTSDFELADGESVGEGSTSVELLAQAPLKDWEWRTHIAFELADGTLLVREIDNVERADGVDEVSWEEELPAMASPVVRIAAAFKARFASDALEENWITDTVMTAMLPQIETLQETEIELEHLPEEPAAGGVGRAPAAGGAPPVETGRKLRFSMEDITGTPIPGLIATSEFDFDVSFWEQDYPGDAPTYDALVEIEGPVVWKGLYTDSFFGVDQAGLFQIFAAEAATLTITCSYTSGLNGKAFFPIKNGNRVTWSDGSKYGMFTDTALPGDFKTLVVAQGDLVEIGMIMTDGGFHEVWTHANHSGGHAYEARLSWNGDADNQASRALTGQVRTVMPHTSQITGNDVFTITLHGDGGIAWEFGTAPAGVTITPSSGSGSGTVVIDTTGGTEDAGIDNIGFTCRPVVRGQTLEITRHFSWRRP